jgi:hypothetical protein
MYGTHMQDTGLHDADCKEITMSEIRMKLRKFENT